MFSNEWPEIKHRVLIMIIRRGLIYYPAVVCVCLAIRATHFLPGMWFKRRGGSVCYLKVLQVCLSVQLCGWMIEGHLGLRGVTVCGFLFAVWAAMFWCWDPLRIFPAFLFHHDQKKEEEGGGFVFLFFLSFVHHTPCPDHCSCVMHFALHGLEMTDLGH